MSIKKLKTEIYTMNKQIKYHIINWANVIKQFWCTYDFRWRHNVNCPITSGSHILDPQNPIFSFRHNFTKKYIYQKYDLFLIQLGQIFRKSQ